MQSEKPTGNLQLITLNTQTPKTTTFSYNGKIMKHTQIIQTQRCDHVTQPQIKNYFTYCQQDKRIKVTQLRIQDQFIKIIDTIDIRNDAQAVQYRQRDNQMNELTGQGYSSQNNIKENRQEKVNVNKYRLKFPNCKIKKNSIKNLIRVFIFWLRDCQLKEQIIQQIQKMIKKYKYNTRLIYQLINCEQIRTYFIQFCQKDAEQYIESSKIVDKNMHLKILKGYLSMALQFQGNLMIKNGQVSILQRQSQSINNKKSIKLN